MTARRRVVVTGLGVISALGPGRTPFLRGLREGRCAILPLSDPALAALGPGLAAAVDAFELPLPRAALRRTSRADQLGLFAALEAAADAALPPALLAEAAVVMGVGAGGAEALWRYVEAHDAHGPRRALPSALVAFPPAGTTEAIARALCARGPRFSLMTACSASAAALGTAADLVRAGRARVALAGGAEPLTRLTLAGFGALRALAPEPCRPFDAGRRGLSLGEGAAVLVLEEEAAARRRGARVLCELAGWGASADAHHMTAPDPDGTGPARAMAAALADAELAPGQIDYINAHGTGTPQNDPIETRAIHQVFGAAASRLLVSSTKSQIGHTLGAAGALEAAATVLGLCEGFAPATVTLRQADPACDLDYVPGRPRPAPIGAALSLSLAFGGNNVALAFRRRPEEAAP